MTEEVLGLTTVKKLHKIIHPRLLRNLKAFGKRRINIAMVSSWGEQCGIAEYSETLLEHLPAWCNVARVKWEDIKSLQWSDVDIVHFQYEPGLCATVPFDEIYQGLTSKRVITTHFYDSRIKGLKADLTIVHNKSNVVIKNHYHIVQGCPVYPEKDKQKLRYILGIPSDALVIASFGFIMGWKHIADMLTGLIPYIALDSRVFLVALHAPHPRAEELGRQVIRAVDGSILLNNLKSRSIVRWEFLSKEEINEYLQASDIGILYAPDGNSQGSSATTKEYVAGRCPVVASQINHYDDLSGGMGFVPPGDIKALVYKTLATLTDKKTLGTLHDEQCKNYNEINYKRVAWKHGQLYREVLNQ